MTSYKVQTYKDGQVTAFVDGAGALDVHLRGNTYEDLFTAASIKDAWDAQHNSAQNSLSTLTLYCLIGQRSDRRFASTQSHDLKVIARFINSMNYDRVEVFHPHSVAALNLINRSEPISPFSFIEQTYKTLNNPTLVSPDAGAYKRTYEIAEALCADFIASNKVRIKGKPEIQFHGDVSDRECLIVDDLADGGRTFTALAQKLRDRGAAAVNLYVSHGLFSYGFDELRIHIDRIFCTNSYRDIHDPMVEQYKVYKS